MPGQEGYANFSGSTDKIRLHALRLVSGQDLRTELERLTSLAMIRAGFVLSAVGSLTRVALRYANQKEPAVLEGHFEIVSLTGTLGQDGMHLHLSVSDDTGRTWGGPLVVGCAVFTTVALGVRAGVGLIFHRETGTRATFTEVVVGDAVGLIFHRETDPRTTFKELTIQRSE